MRISFTAWVLAILAGFLGLGFVFATFQMLPAIFVQHGFRGTAMDEVYHPATVQAQLASNALPDAIAPVDPAGQKSSEAYQNVKVLGDVDAAEFLRLMGAITAWVAPDQGCTYCHNPENLAEDSLYTKIVARRMIQMVQYINSNWKSHVANTGVTCYTCHRGQPVPAYVWFHNPGPEHAGGMSQVQAGKNHPAREINNSSLPYDPFTPFLEGDASIRVQSTQALPGVDDQSIKQTDWTYALMIHFSESLGVNCTYCHNTRSLSSWELSPPQRVTAWYGIRMVRNVNLSYLDSLKGVFPPVRLGEEGDVAKVNCMTCHQGAYKPLYGQSMVGDFAELQAPTAGATPAAAMAPAAPGAAAPTAPTGGPPPAGAAPAKP
jgi:photosynthetic reaction center cytochrome c subunit